MLLTASPVVEADIIQADFNGLFTSLNLNGAVTQNASYPYYGDQTWGYGFRTQISGSINIDMETGNGSATVNFFNFFGVESETPQQQPPAIELEFSAVGDGAGGPGSLLLVNGIWDWNNTVSPFSLVWDGAGLFSAGSYAAGDVISGVGSLAASESLTNSYADISLGAIPIATTAYNVIDGVIVEDPLGIAGSPMVAGPWEGFNNSLDITDLTIVSNTPSVVPVPAAVWLFGSGLIGLFGFAKRRKN